MNECVKLNRDGDVAVITLDSPPVNALSPKVIEGLRRALDAAADARAVVITGAGRAFSAGVDIHEFENAEAGERFRDSLPRLLLAVEDFARPVVMAINGLALGGGFELAMAGHYRLISREGKVGQPEVKLGLIPGAGGTQRLPRLAGIAKAVEMCAFGEPIPAEEALALGIVDRVVEGDLVAQAVAFAREAKPAKTRERAEKLRGADAPIFAAARERARKAKRGEAAPLAAIDAVEAATTVPFDEGCRREAEIFRECLRSAQSRALIRAFLGEREVSKIPDVPSGTPVREIRRVAVIGAGTMGGGIAMCFANAGLPVAVKEQSQEALDRGMAIIRKNYATSVKKGRFSQAVMDARLALITPQLGYGGFEQADLIVEAVFEKMDVKKQVFREIARVAKPECILATNTSTLDIDEIADASGRPEQVMGLHFFSPAHVMRLLEMVRGRATSKEVLATSMALAKKLGKVAVLAANRRGFIGNRTLAPYLREAELLLEEGATVEEVNQALYDFGMAMGPLAMADLIGLDVWRLIREELKPFQRAGDRHPQVLDRLHALGRFGQKTGRGWSKYDESRRPSHDEETAALIEEAAREAGIARRSISAEEIVRRTIGALAAECAQVVKEGTALRPIDIDVVYLLGFGFPAWRGGPMYYAETAGLTYMRQSR
jgi:3-hydroxyacyl-CoA dehydrogenase